MNKVDLRSLVCPRERQLGIVLLVLGIVGWIVLICGTFGIALLVCGLAFLVYLLTHSALIAHIKGNGVEIGPDQFPDLHAQLLACCRTLEMDRVPQAYVLHGNGMLNAFATRFLGQSYVVLLSDVVDAMARHEDGVRFYIAHELGHIRRGHVSWMALRWPVMWLPLLAASYTRARETTCDRHGLACSTNAQNAARALAALSAGPHQWRDINLEQFCSQSRHAFGFWMSFHELQAGYPWLTKRVARVMGYGDRLPSRHPLAYVLSAFLPYGGAAGPLVGLVVYAYVLIFVASLVLASHGHQGLGGLLAAHPRGA